MLAGRNLSLIAALLLCAQSLPAQAPPTRLSLVLLANGRMIEGSLIEGEEYSRILFPTGGEIRLPADAIRFACRSKQDAYWKQRVRLSIRDAEEHYKLAIWCLNEGLANLAKEQVAVCRQAELPADRIEFLARRIQLLEESDPAVDPRAAVLPKAVAAISTDAAASAPPQSVLEFTQTVQPILLNRCAAAACHSNRVNNGFQLIRPLQGRSLAREFTLRNLNSILNQMTQAEAGQTEFEARLHTPHGGIDKAPIESAEQIEAINRWIARLNDPVEEQLADSVQSPRSFLSQPDARVARWADRDKKQTKNPWGEHPQPTGGDPFDPEVFNRRYHPED